MKFDYAPIKAVADSLISQFGKPATLIRQEQTGPDFDPVITETETEITLVETDYSLTNRNESLVQAGDKLWIVQAAAAPTMADKIELDGQRFNMVDIQPLAPGPVLLMFEVQARA